MRTRLLRGVFARAAAPALAMLFVAGAARELAAQTPFVPYFGKNQIHYNNFEWHIYKTDHFEIYYYCSSKPERSSPPKGDDWACRDEKDPTKGVEPQHVERIASYAESAYQQVSADLKHDLAIQVPLIIFKTHSEFEQQNVIPGAAQEGVLAFAEPYRDRMLLPLDEPPDQALRADRSRADAHFRVRHHPAVIDPPQRAALGQRRLVRVRARPLGSAGSHDGPRRGRRRHRAQDEQDGRVWQRKQPAARL